MQKSIYEPGNHSIMGLLWAMQGLNLVLSPKKGFWITTGKGQNGTAHDEILIIYYLF